MYLMLYALHLSNTPTDGSPQQVDAWYHYGSVGVMYLFQKHNDLLPNSGIKPRDDSLMVASLCSYPSSCTTITVGITALNIFPFPRTQQRVCPYIVQCGLKTNNLTNILLSANNLTNIQFSALTN